MSSWSVDTAHRAVSLSLIVKLFSSLTSFMIPIPVVFQQLLFVLDSLLQPGLHYGLLVWEIISFSSVCQQNKTEFIASTIIIIITFTNLDSFWLSPPISFFLSFWLLLESRCRISCSSLVQTWIQEKNEKTTLINKKWIEKMGICGFRGLTYKVSTEEAGSWALLLTHDATTADAVVNKFVLLGKALTGISTWEYNSQPVLSLFIIETDKLVFFLCWRRRATVFLGLKEE